MLYIVIASGIVAVMRYMGQTQLADMLIFDRTAILQGQLWRLFTWPLTIADGSPGMIFMDLILLYCYYSLGRAVENTWGTLRFNIFYLGGIVLMDIFGMTLGGLPIINNGLELLNLNGMIGPNEGYRLYQYGMASMLHLSLLIAFATLYRDAQFRIFFIIPIKAWIIALIYLLMTSLTIFDLSYPQFLFPHNLFPLVGLANYFLFFGKDVLDLLPDSWRRKRKPKQTYRPQQPIHFERSKPKEKIPYIHRCTVCGRTDASNPELEFRYCSRCNGYFCYCEDHISNHTHVE